MCDCGEELERRRQASRGRVPGGVGGDTPAGTGSGTGRGTGRGDGGSNQPEYWTTIIGGTTLLMGLFGLLYKTFDLGTLWRDKVNGLWGGVLDSMCQNYVKDPCAGLRIKDCKRKWTDGTPLDGKPHDSSSPSESCQATIVIELEDD